MNNTNSSIKKHLLKKLLLIFPLIWFITTLATAVSLLQEINEISDTQMAQMARYLISLQNSHNQAPDNIHLRYYFNEDDNKHKSFNNQTTAYTQVQLASIEDLFEQTIQQQNNHPEQDISLSALKADLEEEHVGFAVWQHNPEHKNIVMSDDTLRFADILGAQFNLINRPQQGFVNYRFAFPLQDDLTQDDAYDGSNQNTVISQTTAFINLNTLSNNTWRILIIHNNHFSVAVGQQMHTRIELMLEVLEAQLLPWFIGLLAIMVLIIWAIHSGLRPLTQLSQQLINRSAHDTAQLSPQVATELQPLVMALNQLLKKVHTAIEQEQRFTADAAHELRSPLTVLKVQTDLLSLHASNLNLDQQKSLQQLHLGIDRTSHLLNQLLLLAKVDPNQHTQPANTSPINWLAISDALLTSLNLDAREKHIQLKRHITCLEHEILPLLGNEVLIKLMLRNLLDNAIRYCPTHSTVTLVLNHTCVQVIDNGKGVAKEHLQRLTQRFYRPAGQSQTGSGLGLSIVIRIAQLHGLTLILANKQPHGFSASLERE